MLAVASYYFMVRKHVTCGVQAYHDDICSCCIKAATCGFSCRLPTLHHCICTGVVGTALASCTSLAPRIQPSHFSNTLLACSECRVLACLLRCLLGTIVDITHSEAKAHINKCNFSNAWHASPGFVPIVMFVIIRGKLHSTACWGGSPGVGPQGWPASGAHA